MEIVSSVLRDAGYDALPLYRAPQSFNPSTDAASFPLILNTGSRLPMFIHSEMHNVPWCQELRKDPLLDMNPSDAQDRGVVQGDRVSISTPRGKIQVKVNLTQTVLPGVVHMFHGIE